MYIIYIQCDVYRILVQEPLYPYFEFGFESTFCIVFTSVDRNGAFNAQSDVRIVALESKLRLGI